MTEEDTFNALRRISLLEMVDIIQTWWMNDSECHEEIPTVDWHGMLNKGGWNENDYLREIRNCRIERAMLIYDRRRYF